MASPSPPQALYRSPPPALVLRGENFKKFFGHAYKYKR